MKTTHMGQEIEASENIGNFYEENTGKQNSHEEALRKQRNKFYYNMAVERNRLKELVRELFSYLDAVEESDEGRIFKPVNISCCRVMMGVKMDACLAALKAGIK
jgi:hypothetical protein